MDQVDITLWTKQILHYGPSRYNTMDTADIPLWNKHI